MSGIEVRGSAFPTFCPSSYRSWHMRPDDALQFPPARPEGQNDLPKISSPLVRSFSLSMPRMERNRTKKFYREKSRQLRSSGFDRLDCVSDVTRTRIRPRTHATSSVKRNHRSSFTYIRTNRELDFNRMIKPLIKTFNIIEPVNVNTRRDM